jgi:hypothetical protein
MKYMYLSCGLMVITNAPLELDMPKFVFEMNRKHTQIFR